MCKAQGGLRMCFLKHVLTKSCLHPRWHVFPGASPGAVETGVCAKGGGTVWAVVLGQQGSVNL